MNNEERLIVNEIQKGNKQVFKAIYEEHYKPLVLFASGYLHTQDLSEDVVQNFFIHFWENRSKLQLNSSIKSYCFTSVKNRCLNRLRDYNLRDEKNLMYINSVLRIDLDIDDHENDLVEGIQQALEHLPNQMKEILTKKYFDGLKTSEIADQTGLSENTINTHLKRGRKKLKEFFEGHQIVWLLLFQVD